MSLPYEDTVWLAVALRRLAPAGLGLVFCDAGYYPHVPLRQGITEAEVSGPWDAAG